MKGIKVLTLAGLMVVMQALAVMAAAILTKGTVTLTADQKGTGYFPKDNMIGELTDSGTALTGETIKVYIAVNEKDDGKGEYITRKGSQWRYVGEGDTSRKGKYDAELDFAGTGATQVSGNSFWVTSNHIEGEVNP